MEQYKTFSHKIEIPYSEVSNNLSQRINSIIKNDMEDKIIDGIYLKEITTIDIEKKNKLLYNGSVVFQYHVKAIILNPLINQQLSIKITNINKMGYISQLCKVCIFISNHKCSRIYKIGDTVNIKIIGKRIEQEILCIAEIITV